MKNKEVEKAKIVFNKFFQQDLYGRFDDDKNIILSRGSWNDDVVRLPKFFKFAVNYTLDNHWVGYSDSLGHNNTFDALQKYVNFGKKERLYTPENMALTLGNTATYGNLFRYIKKLYGELHLITGKPYYPPILKSISTSVEDVSFVNVFDSENVIIDSIKSSFKKGPKNVLFLTNYIGVEGRGYSKNYWSEMIKLTEIYDALLVIDEGIWFTLPDYPEEINSNHVLRVVSLSKKYGIPGMKLGFMLSGKPFMDGYYDIASTNYGGPASVFFLLQEMLYYFEYESASNDQTWRKEFLAKYKISEKLLSELYSDYQSALKQNFEVLSTNKQIVLQNISSINSVECFDFGGLNIFLRSDSISSGYDFFLTAIKNEKVSIFPGECLGLDNERYFRITILEDKKILTKGIHKLHKLLTK